MRRLVIFSLTAAALVATSAVAFASPSPKAVLAAMQSAVRAEHSVRYVSVDVETGYQARTVSDVALGKGIQHVVVTEFGKTGPADVRVTKNVAYLKGTVFTLDVFFGFSPAQAKKYAGRWISIPRSDSAFGAIAGGATFDSFRQELFPVAPLYLVNEGRLMGVKGTAPNSTSKIKTILAPKHGTPLPVKATTSLFTGKGTDTWTMSRWNKPVHVVAPAHAVPIRAITGG